jgi:hypothetical protein
MCLTKCIFFIGVVLKRNYKKAWPQFVHLTFQNSIHSAVGQQTVSFFGGFTTMTVKFIYSEKAPKFCKISTIDLSYVCINGQINVR